MNCGICVQVVCLLTKCVKTFLSHPYLMERVDGLLCCEFVIAYLNVC